MTVTTYPERDGDSHLHPRAYHALAVLAGAIGLSASYVTVQLFALAINATEQEGVARELLALAAALFVAAELVAMFVAGLLPVHRLRALRWQLTTCAVALVAFEAVSLYGARVVLIHATDAQASASHGRAEALRSRIEANRRNAAALLAAGEFSSRSILPSSRAEGARSIRDAAAMEADTARLAAELAQLEAARVPTASAVFGESGVIALAVAQSLLISGIGLLFLGAAGALARAARDARTALAPMHPTAPTTTAADALAPTAAPAETDALAPMHLTALADAPTDAPAETAAPRQLHLAVKQTQAAPKGIPPAVPSWGRYALPASALAAGAGLLMPYTGQAETVQPQAQATTTEAAPAQRQAQATATDAPAVADASTAALEPTDALSVTAADAPAETDALAPMHPTASTAASIDAPAPIAALIDAPAAALPVTAAPAVARNDDGARFLRVKAGIEAGRIKPSLRAIYTAEGASQEVARRYLVELEQAGIIERAGRGYALRTTTATQGELV